MPKRFAVFDEERRLLRGGGVDHAAELARLVGDQADRAALEAGEGGDHVGRPFRPDLLQAAPSSTALATSRTS